MEITQRTATLSDASLLLHWRNNPSAREFSLNSKPITKAEHLQWLLARLERTQTEPFLLFLNSSKVIGMTRLDLLSGSSEKYEISILVDPRQHGKGIGTEILKMTCEIFFTTHPDKTILARVHRNNYVSQKLFSSADFDLLTPLGDYFNYGKVNVGKK